MFVLNQKWRTRSWGKNEGTTPQTADDLESAAELCALLGAALQAGLTPERALQVAAVSANDARMRVVGGGLVGACWDVAIETGAAPGRLLSRLGKVLTTFAASARQAEVAAAGPRATIRLVTWLPVAALALAQLAGIPALTVLTTTEMGWVMLLGSAVLMFSARRWLTVLVSRSQRFSWAYGLAPELVAMVLRSAGSPATAWELVAAIPEAGYLSLSDCTRDAEACQQSLQRSDEWGVPAAALLELQAQQLRRQAQHDRDLAHARLSVRVLLPLGVCVLPAFVMLAVVPSVLALLSSTGVGADIFHTSI